jgi:hypothetical protein
MHMRAIFLFLVLSAGSLSSLAAGDAPSRPAEKGCVWERLSDAKLGLEGWVQRCDFGFRKIDLLVQGKSLCIRYSDGGAPDPLIDVLDLRAGETAKVGVKRLFRERTAAKIARRCVLAPYHEGGEPRAGVERLTFVPNAAYKRELDAKADPNEVGDPPCGDWGDAPDGIQYFEVQPGARKVLFVRVGQDTPLFDEKTLVVH